MTFSVGIAAAVVFITSFIGFWLTRTALQSVQKSRTKRMLNVGWTPEKWRNAHLKEACDGLDRSQRSPRTQP
jgi:hypothetical protein